MNIIYKNKQTNKQTNKQKNLSHLKKKILIWNPSTWWAVPSPQCWCATPWTWCTGHGAGLVRDEGWEPPDATVPQSPHIGWLLRAEWRWPSCCCCGSGACCCCWWWRLWSQTTRSGSTSEADATFVNIHSFPEQHVGQQSPPHKHKIQTFTLSKLVSNIRTPQTEKPTSREKERFTLLLLLLRSPAISLGFTIFGWDFCVCGRFFNPTIKVVTFRLRGWCLVGAFLLLAFTRPGHERQDLWVHAMKCVCAQTRPRVYTLIRKFFWGNGVWTHVNSNGKIPSTGKFPQRRIEPVTLWTASPNTTNDRFRPPEVYSKNTVPHILITTYLLTLHDLIREDFQQRNGVAVCPTEHLTHNGQQVPHALRLSATERTQQTLPFSSCRGSACWQVVDITVTNSIIHQACKFGEPKKEENYRRIPTSEGITQCTIKYAPACTNIHK